MAKEWGAKGLAYIVVDENGERRSPIAKFLSEDELAAFPAEPGSTILFGAGEPELVARVLGGLRVHLGRELGLTATVETSSTGCSTSRSSSATTQGRWTFLHHPFTAPMPGQEQWDERDPASTQGQHYDLIWNGWELGSGSIRDPRRRVAAEGLSHHGPVRRGG